MKAKIASLVDLNPFDAMLKRCILSFEPFIMKTIRSSETIHAFVLIDSYNSKHNAIIGGIEKWKVHACVTHGIMSYPCCDHAVFHNNFIEYISKTYGLKVDYFSGIDIIQFSIINNLSWSNYHVPKNFETIVKDTDATVTCMGGVVSYHKSLVPTMPETLHYDKDLVQLYVDFKLCKPVTLAQQNRDAWMEIANHLNDEDARTWAACQFKDDLKWLYERDCL